MVIKGVLRKGRDRLYHKARIAPYLTDLLIVSLLLPKEHFFTYMFAKLISFGIPVVLTVIDVRLAKRLARLAKDPLQFPFRAAAARVNLAYLMMTGALAIIALGIADLVSEKYLLLDASFGDVAIWLIAGQSTAVLFGATTLLMGSVGEGKLCDLLRIIAACVFMSGVWIFTPEDGVLIAQMLAITQITHAGVCAIFLVKNGVWPGLTALLYKQIRIFG